MSEYKESAHALLMKLGLGIDIADLDRRDVEATVAALEAVAVEARREALEEAARLADERGGHWSQEYVSARVRNCDLVAIARAFDRDAEACIIAQAIRALAAPQPPTKEGT